MIFLLECNLYVINISIEAHALSEPNKKSFRPLSAIYKREIKLPGYWLSNFTKVCVTMDSVFNNKDLTNLVFSVRTVNYGSSFFPYDLWPARFALGP